MRGRIRTIKPEAFLDEELWDLEVETGLPVFRGFVGLWTQADREGRFEWRPRVLKSQILPYWDGDFAAILTALQGAGFIARYEANGSSCGVVHTFKKHQVINQREAHSTLPEPPASTCTHVQAREPENVPREAREEVLRRDGHRCVRCGATEDLSIDHIFPRSTGGTHALANLRTLCRPCNSARPVHGEALVADLARDGLTYADFDRTCTHVQARVEGKGTEGNGRERNTDARAADASRALGVHRPAAARLALMESLALEHSARVKDATGKPGLSPSACQAIGRGAPATAHRKVSEHLETLAEWLTGQDPDPVALFRRVLDGAMADAWTKGAGLPLGPIAENPAKYLAPQQQRGKRDGFQPPADHSQFQATEITDDLFKREAS